MAKVWQSYYQLKSHLSYQELTSNSTKKWCYQATHKNLYFPFFQILFKDMSQ